MTNKFIGFLEAVGKNFKKGLDAVLPVAATMGETAVSIFAPALGPMFNQTVTAIVTAEQSAASIGKQQGSGPQKASSVISLMGPLIKQGLADVGHTNDDAAVQKYVDAVVTILNTTPAPALP